MIGSFLEEIIAPIPSPFVMTLAGSVAQSQGYPFWYLFIISLIAAAGKTVGAIVLYWLADKTEDLVLSRIGRFVGITHTEVEKFGQRFSGGWRDLLTLLIIRSTPIIPSAPISLVCGLLRVQKRSFVIATFFGTIVRDFIYLYVGYTSLGAAASLLQGIESVETLVQVFLALAGIAIVGWIVYYRKFRKARPA